MGEMCRRALEALGWGPARVVVAQRPLQRLIGMTLPWGPRSERGSMVMVFPRCSSVHTCFMRRSLDIAFVAGDGSVLNVYEGVPPFRLRSCRGSVMVLERFSG